MIPKTKMIQLRKGKLCVSFSSNDFVSLCLFSIHQKYILYIYIYIRQILHIFITCSWNTSVSLFFFLTQHRFTTGTTFTSILWSSSVCYYWCKERCHWCTGQSLRSCGYITRRSVLFEFFWVLFWGGFKYHLICKMGLKLLEFLFFIKYFSLKWFVL